MIDDFRLRVFETVCRKSSFTAAAKELGVTQPAISQQISELERLIGKTLFQRLPNSVALNENGEVFRTYARQILHWYDVANTAFSKNGLKPKEVELENGKIIQIWSCGDDIHLNLKD